MVMKKGYEYIYRYRHRYRFRYKIARGIGTVKEI
jgi:hypothetical protein